MEIDTTQFEQRLSAQDRLTKAGLVLLAILVLVALGVAGALLLHELRKPPVASFLGLKATSGAALEAFLGAQVQDLSDDVARQLGLQQPGGVLVSGVIVGSPADAAGIQQGDIILEYGRAAVQNVAHLRQMLSESSPGDEVRLLVDRGGRQRQVYVILASGPAPADNATLVAGVAQPSAAEDAAPAWGMTIAPLSPLRAQEQNAPANVTGVVVVSVDPGGAAAAAGLQPGDIIAAVNRRSVDDLASFYAAIAQSDEVLLELYRSGSLLFLSVHADPARPPTAGVAALRPGAPAVGKIVVATDGDSLDSSLAMRFAAAPYFLIVDLSTNSAMAVANPYATASRGIGIPAAQLAINQGAVAVITGRIGPQALGVLQQANVTVYANLAGTAREALTRYQSGELVPTTTASSQGYGSAQRPMELAGGPPSSTEDSDDDEEEGGYEGQPETIPPMGKATAGSSNRPQLCVCPSCGTAVIHPIAVSCASLTCPVCGTALVSSNSGLVTAGPPQSTAPAASPPATTIAGPPQSTGPSAQPTAASSQFPSVCLCPACGTAVVHPAGVPCASLLCPVCGTRLVNAVAGPTLVAQPVPQLPAPAPAPSQGGMGQSQRAPTAGPQGTSVAQQTAGGSSNGVELCFCPACGTIVSHPAGVPCSSLSCPACGSRLMSLDAAISANAAPPSPAQPPAAWAQSLAAQTGGRPDDVPPSAQGGVGSNRTEVCVCPVCGTIVAHPAGVPCSQLTCPQCGSRLVRADTALISEPQAQASVPSPTQPAPNGIWTSTYGMAVWLCPSCGTMIPRSEDDSSSTTPCPSCGTAMLPATAGISLAASSTQLPAASTPSAFLIAQTTPAPAAASAPTVAIPTMGRTTSAEIAPLFDRAPFFLILGLGTFRAIANPNVNDARGVGIQSAQLVVSEGASVVIADNISLEAMKALSDLRVTVYAGVKGTADQALQWFASSRLTETTVAAAPTDDDAHSSGKSKEKAKGEKVAL